MDAVEYLEADAWRARSAAHEQRADELTRNHIARRAQGQTHAIEDFLFTYYNLRPAQLRRWHPGAGVWLAEAPERAEWKWYVVDGDLARVDAAGFLERRGGTVDYIERLMQATLHRAPSFGCYGLHEWAMVYRLGSDELRHRAVPLRLGAAATDEVVERHDIRCSHIDAYRFFTPEAKPLNQLRPTRETQVDMDQAGCLHVGMDVYKWAMKLGPILPGEVLLDAFELAREIRVVDMQASPYDVSRFGLPAIPIETEQGKHEYSELQRDFTERGNALRVRVLDAIRAARETAAEATDTLRTERVVQLPSA